MNILVLCGWMFPDADGGSFRAVYEIAKSLSAEGHHVTVLTQQVDKQAPLLETFEGLQVFRYPVSRRHSFAFFFSTFINVIRQVRYIYKNTKVDAISAHHVVASFGFCVANLLFGRKPFIYHCYMTKFEEFEDEEMHQKGSKRTFRIRFFSWVLRKMESFVLTQASQIIVLSDYVKKLIEKFYPAVSSKIEKVSPGVDGKRYFYQEKTIVKKELKFESIHPLFLTVRRLEPRMGIENLMQTVALLKEKGFKGKFIFVGKGSLYDSLNRLRITLHIEDQVELTGWVPDEKVIQYYQAADLFILPTRALEGFGLVILESLACGTPVMATPVGAIPEVLAEMNLPFLFRNETPQAMAEGLEKWMKEVRPRLPDPLKIRAEVLKKYSWPAHASRLSVILSRITK
jgi:glycosyltransferase involved in cell wall biosynthesis